jgi:hypothetical protein
VEVAGFVWLWSLFWLYKLIYKNVC